MAFSIVYPLATAPVWVFRTTPLVYSGLGPELVQIRKKGLAR